AILGLGTGTLITFAITFASASDLIGWTTLNVSFSYSDGAGGWTGLTSSSSKTTTALLITFNLPANIGHALVDGITERWIRATVGSFSGQPSPMVTRVVASATLNLSGLSPAKAFHGGAAV